MREIKFRGRTKNDKWIYGGYMKNKNGSYIVDTENYNYRKSYKHYLVSEETIGYYTGLKDKNGVEIYEGDILQNDITGNKVIVRFYETRFMLCNDDKLHDIEMYNFLHRIPTLFEVIGNVYEEEE